MAQHRDERRSLMNAVTCGFRKLSSMELFLFTNSLALTGAVRYCASQDITCVYTCMLLTSMFHI